MKFWNCPMRSRYNMLQSFWPISKCWILIGQNLKENLRVDKENLLESNEAGGDEMSSPLFLCVAHFAIRAVLLRLSVLADWSSCHIVSLVIDRHDEKVIMIDMVKMLFINREPGGHWGFVLAGSHCRSTLPPGFQINPIFFPSVDGILRFSKWWS